MARIRIEIVGDPKSAVSAFRTTRKEAAELDRQLRRTKTDMDRTARGVVAGSGVFHGLGRSVAFASSAFLGGAGLIYALRTVVKEARNMQAVQVRTAQAVRNSGNSWVAHRKQIEGVIQAQSRLAAFDDEELLDTFGRMVTRTKDINKALQLNAIATNVARGRNMDLEASGRLVLKASIGQAGALRRLGINIRQGASAQEILTALQERYAHQAERFGKTSEGAQERFNKTLRDSEEIIGTAILPKFDALLRRGTDWLDQQNRSGNLQKIVNQNLADATEIVGGLARGLQLVKTAAEPVVDAVGGIGNAVTALTVLWVANKAKALVSFGVIASSSSLTATKVVADAGRMELALDAATRPRNVLVTTTFAGVGGIPAYGTGKLPKAPTRGGGVPGGSTTKGGIGGLLARAGGYLGPIAAGALSAYAAAPTLTVATIVAILATAGGGSRMGDRSKKYPRVYRAVARAAAGKATPAEIRALQTMGQYSLENAPDKVMARTERALKRAAGEDARYRRAAVPFAPLPPAYGGPNDQPVPPGGGGTPRRMSLRDYQTNVLRARASGDKAGELAALRAEKQYLLRARRSLERRGELSKKEKDQYDNILQQIAGVNADIASLTAKDTTEIKRKHKAAAKAQKDAADAAKEAAQKIKDQWRASKQQAAQAFGDLFGGPILGQGLGDFLREFAGMGATVDPRLILQDIQAQNRQSAALVHNLETIAKRGAPTGLMNELRALGPGGAAFAESLANAPDAIFNAIVKAYGRREAQMKSAAIFIQARNVVVKTDKASGAGDRFATRKAGGGMVPGSGHGDTVPAMLTPGEMVLNRMQQGGLARALGMGGASSQHLFGAISRMASGGVMGKTLDPPFGMTRHGPRQYSVLGSHGAFAPMRPNIGGWLEQFYGRGLSPAAGRRIGPWWMQHFAQIAKGYAGGGVVDRFNNWARSNTPEVNVMRKLGDWLGYPGRTRLGRYGSEQTKMFGETVIPTPAGVKAMGLFARDIGLGYLAPPVFGLQDKNARARARVSAILMVRSMIDALKDPVHNAGFLAGMFVPLPGPGKLTAPTKALERLQLRLGKAGYLAEDVATQAGNLRLRRERLQTRGRANNAPPFNRGGARIVAAQILGSMPKDKLKKALPPGVRTVEDIVVLMEDLYRSARAGSVGRMWYEKSSADILAFAGGDKTIARKVAAIAAIYSPRVSVEDSIKKAAEAYETYMRTGQVHVTGALNKAQARKAQGILEGSAFDVGGLKSGRKIQNFYLDLLQGIDPKWANARRRKTVGAQGATMDVWMARAFGLEPHWDPKKKKFVSDVSSQQYDFMDMVNAAVAGQLGWSRKQTQAAIWTTTKSRFEGRAPNRAATNIGDYLRKQSTQINYEAFWGQFGERIRSELGEEAARQYSLEKFGLLRGARGQSLILEKLGLLGQHGGMQQGVWGIDVSPGAHDLVLAPRIADKLVGKRGLRRMPQFEKQAQQAAAAIGYILHQDAVGTLTEFPMLNAAGNINQKIRAARNAAWLSHKFTDSELAAVSSKVGTKMMMLSRPGGWVIKPLSRRPPANWFAKLEGALSGFQLQHAAVQTELIGSGSYGRLLAEAERAHPGFTAWVHELGARGDAIDRRWARRLMGPMLPIKRAIGGMIPGRGSRDTVPALLTPGEMVLNRRQQLGVSQALGLGRSSGERLFGEIQRFQNGGMLSGRTRSSSSFLPGSTGMMQPAATFEQHNTITVPPHFADTEWAIERGLARATWRLRKGI